jgi:hypothetical protein
LYSWSDLDFGDVVRDGVAGVGDVRSEPTGREEEAKMVGRRELVDTQTRQKNQLKALLLSGDEAERRLSHRAFSQAHLTAIIRRRGSGDETREQAVRRGEARRLAQAIRDGDRDLAANNKMLRELVETLAPELLSRHGIGPVSAAQAIITWSHRGRCRSDASFRYSWHTRSKRALSVSDRVFWRS